MGVQGPFGDAARPVVVLGMHRSGTSLVAELLRDAGVFMGEDLDRHTESRSIRELNRFVFQVGHGDWDYPKAVLPVLEVPELCEALVQHLQARMESEELAAAYLGPPPRFRRRRWPELWGWKDPRNTLTLPLWHRVFPRLRAVHVVRNGIDVANSLVAREQKRVTRLDHRARSVRCLVQERAFELWAEYVEAGLAGTAELPETQALDVVYEELLAAPREQIERMLGFVGVAVPARRLDALAASLDGSRAFAFREGEHPARADQLDHELMRRMGYGEPPCP